MAEDQCHPGQQEGSVTAEQFYVDFMLTAGRFTAAQCRTIHWRAEHFGVDSAKSVHSVVCFLGAVQ